MRKDAVITVRVPASLKRRLLALARRERRSMSAQVTSCLESSLDGELHEPSTDPAKLLGLFAGARVPTDQDFADVRKALWGMMGRDRPGA